MSKVIVEYLFRDTADGEFFIDVRANGESYGTFGPFDTRSERQALLDDLLEMTRSLGAKDLPTENQ